VSPVWVKLYDNAAPVVGTTPSDWVLKVPAGVRRVSSFTQGLDFSTAISFAVVAGAAEANTTAPASAVAIRLLTS